MKSTRICLLLLLLSVLIPSYSQPPGGGRPPDGRPPGGGPEQMIEREKEGVFTKITDLSEDQKLLLEGIYEEFAVTLKETMEEMRQSSDRESRREAMQALRKEKDALIADVLNKAQFEVYQSLSSTRRERRNEREGDSPNHK